MAASKNLLFTATQSNKNKLPFQEEAFLKEALRSSKKKGG
jgi:hypothetical protein